ncbi:uncharacterized protein VTP21DRAFT_4919 [Calcarisporiella thermophila]|uniref:uncharacterized protein n=1 Tax=Calcarisporiella thermophila TaxID=911321 RepID=UPI0037442D44
MTSSTSSSVQFTVGKLDAGMALLLTDDHHLIEFPSLLLPEGVSSGSIVNISVQRNLDAERQQEEEFLSIQDRIFTQYGSHSPETPILRVRAVTQTSVSLEWDPLVLHSAEFKALEIYRDGQRLPPSTVPQTPFAVQTKVTGLECDHEYRFRIVLRTSAGRYESNSVQVKTHSMENLTGIRIAFGEFDGAREAVEERISDVKKVVEQIGAKWDNETTSDTTHLIATTQGGANYDQAIRLSIPVVKPEWLSACQKEGKLQVCLPYFLGPEQRNPSDQ